jgi:hypothetical protein
VVAVLAIFSGILDSIPNVDYASSTSNEDGEDGDYGNGINGAEPEPEPEPSPDPGLDPSPDPSPDPGLVPGPEPPEDPCEENPDSEGCEPEPPVDPCIEDPNSGGCEPVSPPGCSCEPGEGQDCPDIVCESPDLCIEDPTAEGCKPDPCIEDPSLPECEPSPPPDGNCHPSYPDMCIQGPPPDLDCGDVSAHNFKVVGSDPHGFDGDNDGIGCEGEENGGGGGGNGRGCHPSYPDNCIPPPPPDLNCGDSDVPNNVKVVPPDPHRLDGDKDGVGCEVNSISGGKGNGNNDGGGSSSGQCQGQADCFRGAVTEIVDGDTMDINNVGVRLALVNTPERGESGYTEAIDFVKSVCSVGTKALVDEDDRQKEGSFDRLIGLVYCGDDNINNKISLNELLLNGRYAVIYQDFCNISEFSSSSWAQRHGC